ncbi:MAG TPA: class I SAM-dependent methyltransferase [Polyangiaceae bacterium]
MKLHPRTTPWKSSSRRRQARDPDSWVARLEPLAAVREPFTECHRTIVRRVLESHVAEQGNLLEIGAGFGQLASWLGVTGSRFVHTEPDAGALAKLRSRHPSARTEQASAERLPVPDASCTGVIGLCTLDVVADLRATLNEARRVLAPGGVLVHLMDLAPSFDGELRELAMMGKVVLPNLFSDPSEARWPEDLLVTDWAAMKALLAALASRSHPLPHVFGHYFANYERSSFDAAAAARQFEALSRAPEMRELLKTMLASGFALGQRLGVPAPRGTLVSAGRRLSDRIERAAREAELSTERNDVESAWAHAPRDTSGFFYRSLALGHERRSDSVPQRLLCEDAVLPEPTAGLVEASVAVFVARAN